MGRLYGMNYKLANETVMRKQIEEVLFKTAEEVTQKP